MGWAGLVPESWAENLLLRCTWPEGIDPLVPGSDPSSRLIPMGSSGEAMADWSGLRWLRIDLVLRNTHNTFARAHPLVILGGLLMTLAPASLKPEHRPRRFLFRVRDPLGGRMHKGQTFRLSILLPEATADEAAALVTALRQPLHNFELVDLHEPVPRSLVDLLSTSPCPTGVDEVCLDYLTPLHFEPTDPRRPWHLEANQFGALVEHRLRQLFPAADCLPAGAWSGLRTLPYYWRTESVGARSRHSTGQWRVIGNAGSLYLGGPLAGVWPQLLLAEEFPLGDPKIGGGAFRLAFDRPAFAAAVANPQTYLAAQVDLTERTDVQEEFTHALRDPGTVARELATAAAAGQWVPEPARGFRLRKEGGEGERLIAVLRPRDYLLHKALHTLLAPVFDRAFEPASVGYRPGLGPEVVR